MVALLVLLRYIVHTCILSDDLPEDFRFLEAEHPGRPRWRTGRGGGHADLPGNAYVMGDLRETVTLPGTAVESPAQDTSFLSTPPMMLP